MVASKIRVEKVRYQEEILYSEGSKILEQVDQEGCGCSSPDKCLTACWTRPWATQSTESCPCPWQVRLGLDDIQGPFQPLTFYDSK